MTYKRDKRTDGLDYIIHDKIYRDPLQKHNYIEIKYNPYDIEILKKDYPRLIELFREPDCVKSEFAFNCPLCGSPVMINYVSKGIVVRCNHCNLKAVSDTVTDKQTVKELYLDII